MDAILLYHGIADGVRSERVMDDVDREYVLDRRRFEQHMAYLAAKPADSVRAIVSFDDGDLSGYATAAPILERHGLRGEFFVVTTWIGTPGFMTADQLRELVRRGHGVHSHSRTHPKLPALSSPDIERELRGSKEDLESLLGRPVTQFSIPRGAYDDRVVEAAKRAGYSAVMTSVEGYNVETTAFLLKRFTPRAYSAVSILQGICEHPRRTMATLTLKRAALRAARGIAGETGYAKLRRALISRRPGGPDGTSRR